MRFIDLTDKIFGRLTVKEKYKHSKSSRIKWICLCDCGSECTIAGQELKRGETESCGCIRREKNNRYSHGMVDTRPYIIWANMKQRCLNHNHHSYPDYGGRGITIDERWLNSFESFWEDMEDGYSAGLTLDRKNNDLGYGPDNCRWVTWIVQANNRRDKVKGNGLPECIRISKSGKHELRVTLNGTHKTIGNYETLEEAVEIRDILRSKRKVDAECLR